MAVLSIHASHIERTYARSINLLDSHFKEVGNRVGWHQFLGNIGADKVGNVATAQGIITLFTLSTLEPTDSTLLNPLSKLWKQLPKLMSTLRNGQNRDGGWALLSSLGTSTVEGTAWSALGLLAGGEMKDSQALVKAKDWLKNNENGDGGWGPQKGLESRTYTTFLACRCLAAIDSDFVESPSSHSSVKNWLIRCQGDDGGWGETTGKNSTALHTAFALLALKALGVKSNDSEIRRGVRYLYEHWDEQHHWDGQHLSEMYELPSPSGFTRVTIDYFPTPWVVMALLAAGENAIKEQIFASVAWLLRSQNDDGSWSLNNIRPDRSWAVHDALQAITVFLKKITTKQTANRFVLLDDTLVISSSISRIGFLRQILLTSLALLAIGMLIGIMLSALSLFASLNSSLINWLGKYWAWLLLAIVIIGIFPLRKFRVIGWREAILAIVLPAVLSIIQLFLTIH